MLSQHVDAVQVTDNPYGWAQMSAVAASAILLHHEMDAIPILTCRDKNRIALKSDLLGLRALGVSSVLLTRGHRVPDKHEVQAATVFDTTGPELIAMAEEIRQDTDLGPKRDFLIGTGARAYRPKRSWTAESLKARAAAGARFMQTQLCFNMDILRRYNAYAGGIESDLGLFGCYFHNTFAVCGNCALAEKKHDRFIDPENSHRTPGTGTGSCSGRH